MKYETIMALPDDKRKFNLLENKLLKLQWHGETFEEAKREYTRLFKMFREDKSERK